VAERLRCQPSALVHRIVWVVLLVSSTAAHAETSYELWPEFGTFLELNARTRVFLLATTTRVDQEATRGAPLDPVTDGTVGVHLDYSLAPARRRALLDQDWERRRYLWMRIGYQRARSVGDANLGNTFRENRGVFEVNARTPPLTGALEWSTRFRTDVRDRNGEHSNLYRVRLGVERQIDVRGRAVVPYLTAETIYDTRHDEWKQQRYQLGVEFGLNANWRFEPYLETRNDRRSEPARVYALGLALKYIR